MSEPIRTDVWSRQFYTVRAFMEKAVDEAMSFNEFYNLASDEGFSYRRERMLTDWRNVQGFYKFEEQLNNLDSSHTIPDRYVTDDTHSVNYEYLAAVEYKFIDPLTGETIKGTRMVSSDSLLSTGEYVDRASELFNEGGMYEDPSAHDFHVRFVMGRGG
jgi:hypothetical protein